MDRMRLDMHMHTDYSRDSRVALADFAALARKAELGAVCVTDHDTTEGGLRLREMDTGLLVIVGEEITTADGELRRSLPRKADRTRTLRRHHHM